MSTGTHPFLRILADVSRSGKPVAEVSHPGHNVPFDFDFAGVLKRVWQNGRLAVAGWAEVTTKDSAVKTAPRGADLVTLQPDLGTAAEARVQRGDLNSKRSGRPERVSAA
jgi:hypothetical protein